MRFPPPEVLKTWPKPNYVNPDTRGPALIIVELTLLPIAIICVALRLWIRIGWLHKGWWDDWLMVVAVIFSCGTTAIVIMATTMYGWDVHAWDLKPSKVEVGRKVSTPAAAAVHGLQVLTTSRHQWQLSLSLF